MTARRRRGAASNITAQIKDTPVRNRATIPAMNLAVPKPMSLTQFLAWEERQELRYEFDGTRPIAMVGGTTRHSAIQGNLAFTLIGRLRGKPCRFHGSDLKFQVAEGHIRYPDGMVVCSPLDPTATIVHDPVVVFEVLSPSTTRRDRIVKAREYQATPSIQRYVMLEQDGVGATVYARTHDAWSVLVLKPNDPLDMPEIGLSIPLAEFYEGLSFETDPAEDYDSEPAPPSGA